MKVTIKGVDYEQKEITIGCVPYIFDPMKEKIRYLKSINVNLNYGIGEFPISIDFPNDRPKGYYCENLRMLNINVTDISRNDWFK
jgi:hypothetical protein